MFGVDFINVVKILKTLSVDCIYAFVSANL